MASERSIDVEQKKQTKRKLDMDLEQEEEQDSESESESESEEEENLSPEQQQQPEIEKSKEKQVVVISEQEQKGLAKGLRSEANDMKASTSKLFQKKYSTEDEVKILKTLINSHGLRGCQNLWKEVKDSLQLSVPVVHESNLYYKARRLRKSYLEKCKNGNPLTDLDLEGLNENERRIYNLSHELWGKELEKQPRKAELKKAKGRKRGKRAKVIEDADNDMEFENNYRRFLMGFEKLEDSAFCADAALKVVWPSERPKPEQKWEKACLNNLTRYKSNIKLIHRTLEALRPPPPSFL